MNGLAQIEAQLVDLEAELEAVVKVRNGYPWVLDPEPGVYARPLGPFVMSPHRLKVELQSRIDAALYDGRIDENAHVFATVRMNEWIVRIDDELRTRFGLRGMRGMIQASR